VGGPPSDGAGFVIPVLAHAVTGGGQKQTAGVSVDIRLDGHQASRRGLVLPLVLPKEGP